MKNKPKTAMPRFELKMREEDFSRKKNTTDIPENKKGVLRAALCLFLTLGIIMLKFSSLEYAGGIVEKVSHLISTSTDFEEAAQKTIGIIDSTVAKFLGGSVTASGPKESVVFYAPLKEYSVLKGFVSESHPVFATQTSPVGVTLKGNGSDFVYAPYECTVSDITKNADSTYRCVMKISRDLSVAYDNLEILYFGEGDSVKKGGILAALSEENPTLSVEVWENGAAVDPGGYFAAL